MTEARLLDADRRKDEFLAMLAHELRNPLAAISSAVTVARTPHLERERNWSIAVIGRHVRHLEKLIDDLMDVSRITLGKIEMRRERLDLSTVLARAADAVRAQMADRHQQLDVAAAGRAALGRRRSDQARAGVREPAGQRVEVQPRRRPHLVFRHRRPGGTVGGARA